MPFLILNVFNIMARGTEKTWPAASYISKTRLPTFAPFGAIKKRDSKIQNCIHTTNQPLHLFSNSRGCCPSRKTSLQSFKTS
jgi:hypothetical protein